MGQNGAVSTPEPTPRQRIEAACARLGRPAVVAGCVRLLAGSAADTALIRILGGPHADLVLAGRPDQAYWLRVWAARGLLWGWYPTGLPGLRTALGDPAWRVREMAAKVTARHLVGEVFDEVSALRTDPVPRVRQAAQRALRRLTDAGA
jgi:hypothetical protein